jgi:hypothetical protein
MQQGMPGAPSQHHRVAFLVYVLACCAWAALERTGAAPSLDDGSSLKHALLAPAR